MSKTKTFFKLLFVSLSISLSAQNNATPYSAIGLGDEHPQGFGQNRAMGGVSTAIRSYNNINYQNPASYTAFDSNSFVFDVGFSGSISALTTNEGSASVNDYGMNNIALGFPIFKRWKSSFGLVPYSQVGYDIESTSNNPTLITTTQLKGDGGLSSLYFGNAFLLHKNLSVGFNTNYFFGHINREQLTSFPEIPNSGFTTKNNSYYIKDFGFVVGAQFHKDINKEMAFTLGGTYDYQPKLNYSESSTGVNSLSGTNSGTLQDTIMSTEASGLSANMPNTFNIGVAFEVKNKLIVGVDYKNRSLTDNATNPFYQNVANRELRVGTEYIPDKMSYADYFKRVKYRVGAYYSDGALNVNDYSLSNMGLTLGLGLPFKFSGSTLNLTYGIGVRGTTDNNLIKENYNYFLLNFTFTDIWFIQKKYN